MKYDSERDRAHFLGSVLSASDAASLFLGADYVVPVPMHPRRRRERGYNQAELIAGGTCDELKLAPPVNVLVQHEERPSQVGLTGRQRRTNVRGAFSVNPGIVMRTGARIVLVDDVMTTGSTVSACAAALSPFRPGQIDVVTFARELMPEVKEHLGL